MATAYVIWFGSIALCILGWAYFRTFYEKHKRYFVPYLIFLLGNTLLVISIFIIGEWAGLAYAFISLIIMGLGLIIGFLILMYSYVQRKFR